MALANDSPWTRGGLMTDAELSDAVRNGDGILADRAEQILKFRNTIREAQGRFRGNADGTVHVDALADNARYWCDDLRQEAANEKAKALKKTAEKISGITDKFPDWEKVDPTAVIMGRGADPSRDEINRRRNVYDITGSYGEYLNQQDTPDIEFLSSTKKKVRYQWCEQAKQKYDSCEAQYANAKDKSVFLGRGGGYKITAEQQRSSATQCASDALDTYAGINQNTSVNWFQRKLYEGEGVLEGASFVPGLGIPASLALAALYAGSGDLWAAGGAAAGAIPGEKVAATLGLAGAKTIKAIDSALPRFLGAARRQIDQLARMTPEAAEDAIKAAKLGEAEASVLRDAVNARREARSKLQASIDDYKRKLNGKAEVCKC